MKFINYLYEWKLDMAFFQSSVETLQTLVVALGAGLRIWGQLT